MLRNRTGRKEHNPFIFFIQGFINTPQITVRSYYPYDPICQWNHFLYQLAFLYLWMIDKNIIEFFLAHIK